MKVPHCLYASRHQWTPAQPEIEGDVERQRCAVCGLYRQRLVKLRASPGVLRAIGPEVWSYVAPDGRLVE